MRLAGGQLLLVVGSTHLTQICLCVPTDLVANPVTATRALAKIRTGFLDGLCQRRIVQLPANDPLHFVDRRSGPAPTAQKVACYIDQRLGDADGGGVELRHVAIATLVTMKLELIATIRGQVIVVVNELNEGHMLTIV